MLRKSVHDNREPIEIVMGPMLLQECLYVVGYQPEVVSRHARKHMVLIVELHSAVEPIEPARGLVINADFDTAFRKAQVLCFIYLDQWLIEVISPQLPT